VEGGARLDPPPLGKVNLYTYFGAWVMDWKVSFGLFSLISTGECESLKIVTMMILLGDPKVRIIEDTREEFWCSTLRFDSELLSEYREW